MALENLYTKAEDKIFNDTDFILNDKIFNDTDI